MYNQNVVAMFRCKQHQTFTWSPKLSLCILLLSFIGVWIEKCNDLHVSILYRCMKILLVPYNNLNKWMLVFGGWTTLFKNFCSNTSLAATSNLPNMNFRGIILTLPLIKELSNNLILNVFGKFFLGKLFF